MIKLDVVNTAKEQYRMTVPAEVFLLSVELVIHRPTNRVLRVFRLQGEECAMEQYQIYSTQKVIRTAQS